ncbi:MAG TPA: hybrid sensor histidine kinase/response regulator [Pararobbsia sp.]|nr:hybrid sensor histidine kinase/response regulator [Pararobbsia sp.]
MSSRVKVLLVDDIEQNLIALEALLDQPQIETLRARSGADALELLLEHDFALALIDVQMPGMDGFELAEYMRGSRRTRQVPIIFLTATDRSAVRTFRGYESGAVDFLYKPFDPHILYSKVEVFVELYTQRRQLGKQLDELEQSMRMNEMFMAVLGHDLRNPLASIMASAELIARLSSDNRLTTSAQRILNSGTRMTRMVEQLVDIARMRAGQMTLSRSFADMTSVCARIVAEFDRPLDSATPRILYRSRGDTEGYWDIDRLGQVWSNLVGNALQHGDPTVPVEVDLDGDGTHALRVSVESGGAIPDAVAQNIFEPFFSDNRHRERSGGLGLGLYIAHEIVRLHDGEIRVDSSASLNRTRFEVSLPRSGPQ